jgi:hypothetical protein
VNKQHILD